MNLGVTLFMMKFGQLAVITGGLVAFVIYLLLLTRSFKTSIAIAAIVYSIEILIDHSIDIVFRIMKLDENTWVFNSSFLLMGIILAVGLYFFLQSDLEHNLQKDYQLSSTEMIFMSIVLIIMIFLITVTEVMQGNNLKNIIYNFVIIILFAIMFASVHIARIKAMNKDLELREQKGSE
ncbi:hypothetical protein [Companilactobacillus paralimentarius]|uniref:hypothetical protein n=1 Tax=Companilactobacillus paralimentarius TaxID=83526 RepID=UPI003850CC02